ncbi:MAG: flagellar FlbD family protein [Oscillospiraceae bacterium]
MTRLNGIPFILNCDLIETVSENPDTTIRLINGSLHIVKESMHEVVQRTIEYRRKIYTNMTEGEWHGEK